MKSPFAGIQARPHEKDSAPPSHYLCQNPKQKHHFIMKHTIKLIVNNIVSGLFHMHERVRSKGKVCPLTEALHLSYDVMVCIAQKS